MNPRLYHSRNEAIEREILEPLAEDLDALLGDAPDGMVRLYYDVDAIADEILSTAAAPAAEGGQLRYHLSAAVAVAPDLFWGIVERHALAG